MQILQQARPRRHAMLFSEARKGKGRTKPRHHKFQAQAQVMETSLDAGTEQILLTKDNFKDMLLSLSDKECATVVEEI